MRTTRNTRKLLLAAGMVTGFVSHAEGTTFNVSWDGGATGSYNTAVNWSTNTVPLNVDVLNDYYNVTLNRTGGTNVTANLSQIQVLNLTIGATAGNQLTLADNCTFGVIGTAAFGPTTVTNGGTIQIGATSAAASQFNFLGSTTNLTGGGTISMIGANTGIFGNGTVTSNNTIIGFGEMGIDSLSWVNNGTVTASGGSLTVDMDTGGFDNNALMQAIAGGTLVLSGNGGGTFANGGGTITNNGGRVQLVNGATIAGGNIATQNLTGSSIFFVPNGNAATLSSVSSTADVSVGINSTLTLTGTITNNGRIRTNSSIGVATFNVGSGTTTLTGSGSLVLSQLTGALGNMVGTGTLVNGASHSIVGAGSIGNNTMVIRNNGLMGSTNVGVLTIDPTDTGTGFFNSGTLHAGASLLTLGDGVYSNSGTIESAGQLFMQDVTINGGTLQIVASALISKVSGAQATWNNLQVTNSGDVSINVGTLNVGTSTINNGAIVGISANTVDANLAVTAGTMTLTGGGDVLLVTGGAGVAKLVGVGTLNNTNNLIHGQGEIGGGTLRIFNAGTISADVTGATLTVDPVVTGGLNNAGTLEATNGGLLVLTGNGGGVFSNTGTVSAAGGTVLLTGGANVGPGTIRSNAGGRVQVVSGQTGGLAGVTNLAEIFNSDGTLTLNSIITNNATITIGGGANAATVALVGIGATLNGTGRMELGPTGTGTVVVGGIGTLTNGPSHLIRGRGELGNNVIPIVNNGRIESATAAAPLVINPSVAGMTNNGTITADSAQIVLTGLGGGAIDNTNGRIIATNTIIRLEDGVAINGGTLGGSVFRVFGGESTTLTGINNTGYILADNNGSSDGTISLAGTINNIGTFEIRSANSGHKARLLMTGGTVTLNGGGTIILSGNGDDSSIEGTFINTNNLIRGDGDIFGGTIINQSGGVISADVGATALRIFPGTFSPLQNAGLMRATNGGILQLESVTFGGGYTNTGAGTMLAENGSTLRLERTSMSGGTLLTSGTGTIDINSSSLSSLTLNGHVVHDSGELTIGTLVTNNGLIETSNNNIEIATIVNSSLVNNGTMTINPGTFISSQILGGGSLTNTGVMSGNFKIDPSGASTFTIANSGLMETTGVGATVALDNQGGGSLGMSVSHTGTLRANSSGSFLINSGVLVTGNGTVDVRADATFLTGGTVTLGNTVVDGTAIVGNLANLGRTAGVGTLNAGFFFGLGTLTGNVTVTHSRVATVNLFNGSTITTTAGGGTLGTSRVTTLNTINGGTGAFNGRWDLTNHDLVVDYAVGSPFATILSLVQTGFAGGAWTGNGLTSSSAQAAAATSNRTGLAIVEAGELFLSFPQTFSGQSIDSTTLLIKYTLLGDANLDSAVDIGDFAALAANFNTGGRWNRGDFNYDQQINIGDFALLASNFNKSLPSELPRGSSVPEPAAMLSLLVVAGSMNRPRRRRGC